MRRVFVANRGEIALRVIHACHALGYEAVLGASEPDLDSVPAARADRVVCVGPARAAESYLNAAGLVAAAVGTGCDALHPGYGFLAEDPSLGRCCGDAGIVFVGPDPEVIQRMGNKIAAIESARACGVPTRPSSAAIETDGQADEFAAAVGLPLMVKAAAGGGGRGMRIVRTAEALSLALAEAAAEALAAFSDPTVFLEPYVERGRHVEVQVLADRHGRVVHLGERDCSIQRRHQKIIEEAPAPRIPEQLRDTLCASAVRLAEYVGYRNAGTVEFLVDVDRQQAAFLEMNTRVQVEHPITEAVTGVDIVAHQLMIAAGRPLSIGQDDVTFAGHAIECRVTAESAADGFRPSPGTITEWEPPVGPGVRVDTHGARGYTVPPFYDSLLAKVICHRPTRELAIEGMTRAIAGFTVAGVDTTLPFLSCVLDDPGFRAGTVSTSWVDEELRAVGSPR
ncbi:MAG: acetyl-CoA carboxylase biotin carboxylase subunit [Sciscionella sp.]